MRTTGATSVPAPSSNSSSPCRGDLELRLLRLSKHIHTGAPPSTQADSQTQRPRTAATGTNITAPPAKVALLVGPWGRSAICISEKHTSAQNVCVSATCVPPPRLSSASLLVSRSPHPVLRGREEAEAARAAAATLPTVSVVSGGSVAVRFWVQTATEPRAVWRANRMRFPFCGFCARTDGWSFFRFSFRSIPTISVGKWPSTQLMGRGFNPRSLLCLFLAFCVFCAQTRQTARFFATPQPTPPPSCLPARSTSSTSDRSAMAPS